MKRFCQLIKQDEVARVMFSTVIALLLVALWFGYAVSARAQSNVIGTLLGSAARTTTTDSADVNNTSYRGAHIVINVTSYTSGQWTPVVQGKDPISGNYYTILTGPTISATGTTVIKVYPGLMAQSADDPIANDFLPRTWRVRMSGGATPSATYSVGYLADY